MVSPAPLEAMLLQVSAECRASRTHVRMNTCEHACIYTHTCRSHYKEVSNTCCKWPRTSHAEFSSSCQSPSNAYLALCHLQTRYSSETGSSSNI